MNDSLISFPQLCPPPPLPWPEEVDGRARLNEIHEFIGRFVAVTPHVLVALTLPSIER